MKPEIATLLVTTLAETARSLGAHEVDLGHSLGEPGVAGALALVPGAVRELQIFRREGEEAYVLEAVSLVVRLEAGKVTVRAQWDRKPEPAELDLLDRAVELGKARTHTPVRFVVGDLRSST